MTTTEFALLNFFWHCNYVNTIRLLMLSLNGAQYDVSTLKLRKYDAELKKITC